MSDKWEDIPMTEEEIAEITQCWKDIEESIDMVMENGEDL